MTEEIKKESPKSVPILTISALEGKEGRWNPSLTMCDSLAKNAESDIDITPFFCRRGMCAGLSLVRRVHSRGTEGRGGRGIFQSFHFDAYTSERIQFRRYDQQ